MASLITVHRCGNPSYKAAVAETQGKRPHQEDVHAVSCTGTSADFWVLDGHRGASAAQFGAAALSREIGGIPRRHGGKLPTVEMVNNAFERVDNQLRKHLKKDPDNPNAGSTVIGALVNQQTDGTYSLLLLNCGDSRGVVIRRPTESKVSASALTVGLPQQLEAYRQEDDWDADASWLPSWPAIVESIDHKPTFPLERARIEAAGGRVSIGGGTKARVDGHLAVSRGLGDFSLKNDKGRSAAEQKVSCVPDVYSVSGLKSGTIILLACDGLWDKVTTDFAATFVHKRLQRDPSRDLGEIAAELTRHCILKGSCDNVTVMLVQLAEGESWADGKQAEVLLPVRARNRRNTSGRRTRRASC